MLVKQQLGLAVGKMITEELNCNSFLRMNCSFSFNYLV